VPLTAYATADGVLATRANDQVLATYYENSVDDDVSLDVDDQPPVADTLGHQLRTLSTTAVLAFLVGGGLFLWLACHLLHKQEKRHHHTASSKNPLEHPYASVDEAPLREKLISV